MTSTVRTKWDTSRQCERRDGRGWLVNMANMIGPMTDGSRLVGAGDSRPAPYDRSRSAGGLWAPTIHVRHGRAEVGLFVPLAEAAGGVGRR